MILRRLSRSRRRAYGTALAAIAVLTGVLFWPSAAWLQAAGEPTPGHANLSCDACHVPAPGTLRQQIQGSVHYLFGWRDTPAAIGNAPVADATCAKCHERTKDNHSLSTLSETRFLDVQASYGVHHCTGCHNEHHGVRVSVPSTICSNCHQDTEKADDPISPDHKSLVAQEAWDTCLRCHDFHGNHNLQEGDHKFPTRLEDGFTLQAVRDYLRAGEPIYGPVVTPAKRPGDSK